MIEQAIQLKADINQDIKDIMNAEHEKLLNRNDNKLQLMRDISQAHKELNDQLANEMNNGVDIDIYREIVDELEEHLTEVYALNGRLAAIVLPIKQMYTDIVNDIAKSNGGQLIEVSG
jgi:ABC-type transporter lipoprotein component MlaA